MLHKYNFMEELTMAKAIKFNLICDDKPIRTIEDLRNNFSIEDVLEYYNNNLLHRWLEVRGYSDSLKKISTITSEKPLEIIKELIVIFNVASDEKKIEEAVYILEYLDERKKLCDIYNKNDFKTKSLIDDYQTGYSQLVNGILENPEDVALIKANISEMITNYKWVMDLNHRKLFWTLKDESILAVMCLLMNEISRDYYLPIESTNEDGVITKDIDTNGDKKNMFNAILNLSTKSYTPRVPYGLDLLTKSRDNLIIFSGITDGYWKDIEPKGKKFMIISMGEGDFIRSAGVFGGDLSIADVEDKFVILDGIDYKSNSLTSELLYMEV